MWLREPVQLNPMKTSIATWSSDSEEYWVQTVRMAKEAHGTFSRKTPAERALAGGSECRLLGIRMPEKVPTLEKHLRTELMDAIPDHLYREATVGVF